MAVGGAVREDAERGDRPRPRRPRQGRRGAGEAGPGGRRGRHARDPARSGSSHGRRHRRGRSSRTGEGRRHALRGDAGVTGGTGATRAGAASRAAAGSRLRRTADQAGPPPPRGAAAWTAQAMRWVALLRAVNLGARNKVPMAQLRAALEAEGYENVRTYIASGNVLLYGPAGRAALGTALESLIA